MAGVEEYVASLAAAAHTASVSLRSLSAQAKNTALASIAGSLEARRDRLAEANGRDLERGKQPRQKARRLQEQGLDAVARPDDVQGLEGAFHLDRAEGRRAASEFLHTHSGDLGTRSTTDLDVLLAEC